MSVDIFPREVDLTRLRTIAQEFTRLQREQSIVLEEIYGALLLAALSARAVLAGYQDDPEPPYPDPGTAYMSAHAILAMAIRDVCCLADELAKERRYCPVQPSFRHGSRIG